MVCETQREKLNYIGYGGLNLNKMLCHIYTIYVYLKQFFLKKKSYL